MQTENKSVSLKVLMEMLTFHRFCLESISSTFDYVDSEKISFKGSVFDFLVDYGAIDKSKIF